MRHGKGSDKKGGKIENFDLCDEERVMPDVARCIESGR